MPVAITALYNTTAAKSDTVLLLHSREQHQKRRALREHNAHLKGNVFTKTILFHFIGTAPLCGHTEKVKSVLYSSRHVLSYHRLLDIVLI